MAMMRRAADSRCDAIVPPECLDLAWPWPEARTLAQPIPGESSAQLAAAAKQHGIWVVAGGTEHDGDNVFNSAVLPPSDGELLGKHRKINELAIAHHLYDWATGSRRFSPLSVCSASRSTRTIFRSRWSSDRVHGVRVLLSPCVSHRRCESRQRQRPLRRSGLRPTAGSLNFIT